MASKITTLDESIVVFNLRSPATEIAETFFERPSKSLGQLRLEQTLPSSAKRKKERLLGTIHLVHPIRVMKLPYLSTEQIASKSP
jgi:hypothetical protein